MTKLGPELETLARTIAERSKTDPKRSWTAQLVAAGPKICARKIGEEALEMALAMTANNRSETIEEAADLLYHLLVGLYVANIDPDEIADVLQKRRNMSGLDEKAARKNTTKK